MVRTFISYSKKYNELADRVKVQLEQYDIPVWKDDSRIRGGDVLQDEEFLGVKQCDVLLVLVCDSDGLSDGVTRELDHARQESKRILPVVHKNVSHKDIPAALGGLVYVRIDDKGNLTKDIRPDLFHDSDVLHLALSGDYFLPNERELHSSLENFVRGKQDKLRFFVDHGEVDESAAASVAAALDRSLPSPVAAQVKSSWENTQPRLRTYWASLGELLSQAATNGFARLGKKHGESDTVAACTLNTLRLCHYALGWRLSTAVFPDEAERAGHPSMASFIKEYGQFSPSSLEFSQAVRRACDIDQAFAHTEECQRELCLAGRQDGFLKSVDDCRVYIPRFLINESDVFASGGKPPEHFIDRYSWFVVCLPQIICSRLLASVFGHNRYVWEMELDPGLDVDDYQRIGFA